METISFEKSALTTRDRIAERVATYARRHFHGEVDDAMLDLWAEEAVTRVWGDGVRVTTFVPMLALRDVREHVHTATRG
jgi:hypothetical protein